MRRGMPSLTASAVSLFRGLASLPGSGLDFANDAGMRALLPAPARAALESLGVVTARAPGLHAWIAAPTAGLLRHVALRTAAIDAALRSERERGIPQLVLLGAGLDARAFRMPELGESTVIEVDFPSTQALKRARAADRRPMAKELRWAPIDFEQDGLDAVLARAGHAAERRTVWVWEGVTMYLPPAAIAQTLDAVRARSAPGSVLLVTYATEAIASILEGPLSPLAPLVALGFRALGEPLRGQMTPEAMHALLARAGFETASDTGPTDWARAYDRSHRVGLAIGERLVRAERT